MEQTWIKLGELEAVVNEAQGYTPNLNWRLKAYVEQPLPKLAGGFDENGLVLEQRIAQGEDFELKIDGITRTLQTTVTTFGQAHQDLAEMLSGIQPVVADLGEEIGNALGAAVPNIVRAIDLAGDSCARFASYLTTMTIVGERLGAKKAEYEAMYEAYHKERAQAVIREEVPSHLAPLDYTPGKDIGTFHVNNTITFFKYNYYYGGREERRRYRALVPSHVLEVAASRTSVKEQKLRKEVGAIWNHLQSTDQSQLHAMKKEFVVWLTDKQRPGYGSKLEALP